MGPVARPAEVGHRPVLVLGCEPVVGKQAQARRRRWRPRHRSFEGLGGQAMQRHTAVRTNAAYAVSLDQGVLEPVLGLRQRRLSPDEIEPLGSRRAVGTAVEPSTTASSERQREPPSEHRRGPEHAAVARLEPVERAQMTASTVGGRSGPAVASRWSTSSTTSNVRYWRASATGVGVLRHRPDQPRGRAAPQGRGRTGVAPSPNSRSIVARSATASAAAASLAPRPATRGTGPRRPSTAQPLRTTHSGPRATGRRAARAWTPVRRCASNGRRSSGRMRLFPMPASPVTNRIRPFLHHLVHEAAGAAPFPAGAPRGPPPCRAGRRG